MRRQHIYSSLDSSDEEEDNVDDSTDDSDIESQHEEENQMDPSVEREYMYIAPLTSEGVISPIEDTNCPDGSIEMIEMRQREGSNTSMESMNQEEMSTSFNHGLMIRLLSTSTTSSSETVQDFSSETAQDYSFETAQDSCSETAQDYMDQSSFAPLQAEGLQETPTIGDQPTNSIVTGSISLPFLHTVIATNDVASCLPTAVNTNGSPEIPNQSHEDNALIPRKSSYPTLKQSRTPTGILLQSTKEYLDLGSTSRTTAAVNSIGSAEIQDQPLQGSSLPRRSSYQLSVKQQSIARDHIVHNSQEYLDVSECDIPLISNDVASNSSVSISSLRAADVPYHSIQQHTITRRSSYQPFLKQQSDQTDAQCQGQQEYLDLSSGGSVNPKAKEDSAISTKPGYEVPTGTVVPPAYTSLVSDNIASSTSSAANTMATSEIQYQLLQGDNNSRKSSYEPLMKPHTAPTDVQVQCPQEYLDLGNGYHLHAEEPCKDSATTKKATYEALTGLVIPVQDYTPLASDDATSRTPSAANGLSPADIQYQRLQQDTIPRTSSYQPLLKQHNAPTDGQGQGSQEYLDLSDGKPLDADEVNENSASMQKPTYEALTGLVIPFQDYTPLASDDATSLAPSAANGPSPADIQYQRLQQDTIPRTPLYQPLLKQHDDPSDIESQRPREYLDLSHSDHLHAQEPKEHSATMQKQTYEALTGLAVPVSDYTPLASGDSTSRTPSDVTRLTAADVQYQHLHRHIIPGMSSYQPLLKQHNTPLDIQSRNPEEYLDLSRIDHIQAEEPKEHSTTLQNSTYEAPTGLALPDSIYTPLVSDNATSRTHTANRHRATDIKYQPLQQHTILRRSSYQPLMSPLSRPTNDSSQPPADYLVRRPFEDEVDCPGSTAQSPYQALTEPVVPLAIYTPLASDGTTSRIHSAANNINDGDVLYQPLQQASISRKSWYQPVTKRQGESSQEYLDLSEGGTLAASDHTVIRSSSAAHPICSSQMPNQPLQQYTSPEQSSYKPVLMQRRVRRRTLGKNERDYLDVCAQEGDRTGDPDVSPDTALQQAYEVLTGSAVVISDSSPSDVDAVASHLTTVPGIIGEAVIQPESLEEQSTPSSPSYQGLQDAAHLGTPECPVVEEQ